VDLNAPNLEDPNAACIVALTPSEFRSRVQLFDVVDTIWANAIVNSSRTVKHLDVNELR
jgi:hypothetical protein